MCSYLNKIAMMCDEWKDREILTMEYMGQLKMGISFVR